MAIAREVVGPHKVQILAADDGSTWVDIGYTPNGERPIFEREIMGVELGSTEHGDEVEQVVYTGSRGTLQFTLTKWDEDNLDGWLQQTVPDAGGSGDDQAQMGSIGSLLLGANQAASYAFGVRFLTPITGRIIYTFTQCYFLGPGSVRIFEMGNTDTRYAFTMQVRRPNYPGDSPDGADDMYAKATA